jgi:hypothetical protein
MTGSLPREMRIRRFEQRSFGPFSADSLQGISRRVLLIPLPIRVLSLHVSVINPDKINKEIVRITNELFGNFLLNFTFNHK